MWLFEWWLYKPLYTLFLCGKKTKLKIGRFRGVEQPALSKPLKNTLYSIDILFAYDLCMFMSVIELSVKIWSNTQRQQLYDHS